MKKLKLDAIKRMIPATAAAVMLTALAIIISAAGGAEVKARRDERLLSLAAEVFDSAASCEKTQVVSDSGEVYAVYDESGATAGWCVLTEKAVGTGNITIVTGVSTDGELEAVFVKNYAGTARASSLLSDYTDMMRGLRDTVQLDTIDMPAGLEPVCRVISEVVKDIIILDLTVHPDIGKIVKPTQPTDTLPGDTSADQSTDKPADTIVTSDSVGDTSPGDITDSDSVAESDGDDNDKKDDLDDDKIKAGKKLNIDDPPETTAVETFIDTMPNTDTTDTETTAAESSDTEPIESESSDTEPPDTEPIEPDTTAIETVKPIPKDDAPPQLIDP